MTRDDIIKAAAEAELLSPDDPMYDINNGVEIWVYGEDGVQMLERFAALIAAQEREACARVCETMYDNDPDGWKSLVDCAETIRARGQA